jgi:hypothetical protein
MYYVDYGYDYNSDETITNVPFPSIPAGGWVQVEVGYYFYPPTVFDATVYEDAEFSGYPAQAQDTEQIFEIFNTTPPSGGVPVGGGSSSAPGFGALPELTNLVLTGPSLVNENSSVTFIATASFGDGSSSTILPTVWSSSLFSVANGILSAGNVSADTVLNLSGRLTVRGVTETASLNTTVVKVQAPQLQPQGLVRSPFRIQLAGTTGLKYALQAATNLGPGQSWLALATNQISSNSVTQFADPGAATNSRRFYRVQVVP